MATSGQPATATFTGSNGQRIAVVVNAVATSNNGCKTLTLFDPNNVSLGSDFKCGDGNPVSIAPINLTISGTYQVRLEFDTTATGSGTLWVSAPVIIGSVTVNGPSMSMNVTRVGQGVIRTFDGTAGQRITVVVNGVVTSNNGCKTLTLFDPSGVSLGSDFKCGDGNPVSIGPINLTSSGTYQVRLEVDTTATGSGTLWVSAPVTIASTRVRPPPALPGGFSSGSRPLAPAPPGGPGGRGELGPPALPPTVGLRGCVTVNGPSASMNVTRVGQGVICTFDGAAGQRIAVVVNAVATSNNGCKTLTLFDPNNVSLGSDFRCGDGNPVSIGPINLTTSGTYQVRLEFDTTATGSGTLWVSAPVIIGSVTVNGPSMSMNVTRVGQGVIRTFDGTAGQRITVVVNGVVTSNNGCKTLTLFDPSGVSLGSDFKCGDGNPVSIAPINLTTSGTYQVRLEVDTTATGSGTLWVSAPVTLCSVTVNGPSASMNVTRVGQGVICTFGGAVGQRITVVVNGVVTSNNGCKTLTLFDPSGVSLGSDFKCGDGNPLSIGPINLTSSGTYQVRLEVDTTATGSGTLWVSAPVTVCSLTVNGPSASMNVIRVGQGVICTFGGAAGQRITVVVNGVVTSNNGCKTLTLFDPSGVSLGSDFKCGDGNPLSIGPIDLTSSGTYQVRLELDTTATGSGTLSVSA